MSLKSRDFKIKALVSVVLITAFVVAAFAFASDARADEQLADKAKDLIEQDRIRARIEKNPDLAKVLKQLAKIRK